MLVENINPGAKEPYKHFALSFSSCPPQLAAIFRSTQSLSALETLDNSIKNSIVNTKGETLEQYNQRVTRANPNAENRIQNLSIMDFKEKHAQQTERYLDKTKEENLVGRFDFIVRGGIDFLTNGEKYREKYEEKQENRIRRGVIERKEIRNEVWSQVNALCQEQTVALKLFSKDDAVAQGLVGRLQEARIAFMASRPDKKESLKSAYMTETGMLNLVTADIVNYLSKKEGHDFSALTQKIETLSQNLNANIMAPQTPNMVVSAMLTFKERLGSLTGGSKKDQVTENTEVEKGQNLKI